MESADGIPDPNRYWFEISAMQPSYQPGFTTPYPQNLSNVYQTHAPWSPPSFQQRPPSNYHGFQQAPSSQQHDPQRTSRPLRPPISPPSSISGSSDPNSGSPYIPNYAQSATLNIIYDRQQGADVREYPVTYQNSGYQPSPFNLRSKQDNFDGLRQIDVFPVHQSITSARETAQDGETRLHSAFKNPRRPRVFFKVGKVFRVLWSEPGANLENVSDFTSITAGTTKNKFGEPVFTKIRSFVVVKEGLSYCLAVPILTYGHQGVSKKGIVKSEHAVVHTGKLAPALLPDEAPGGDEEGMAPEAIRVDPDDPKTRLDPTSRINFGAVYTIQYNIKVMSFGRIHRGSISALIDQFLQTLLKSWVKTEDAGASMNGVFYKGQLNGHPKKADEQPSTPPCTQHSDIRPCAKEVTSHLRSNGRFYEAIKLEQTLSSIDTSQGEVKKAPAAEREKAKTFPNIPGAEQSDTLTSVEDLALTDSSEAEEAEEAEEAREAEEAET